MESASSASRKLGFEKEVFERRDSLPQMPRATPVLPVSGETGKAVMARLPRIHLPEIYSEDGHGRKYQSYKLISCYAVICELEDIGDFAQFGVFRGFTARFLTGFVPKNRRFHLFDSFEGLPEGWASSWDKGHFSLGGKIPRLDMNVCQVHQGWFKDTVPAFAAEHVDPLALLHLDADLYSSTIDVLFNLNAQIIPGSILLFDEYVMQGREEEHRALLEWASKFNREFEYLWRTDWVQVAVRVKR